jgi:YhgE/Pip-like protein
MPPPELEKPVTAWRVLRSPKFWLLSSALVALLTFLLPLAYIGGIVDPTGELHLLPIGLVDEDRGAVAAGHRTDLGAQIAASILATPTPHDEVSWRPSDLAAARQALGRGALYGVLLIPPGFTASVLALGESQPKPARPRIDVLTNPAAGSLASSLATTAAQQTARTASLKLGAQITSRAPGTGATSNAERLLLADPVTVTVAPGIPLGTHSGLGLTAFYYSLSLVLAGFIGGTAVNNGADAALGYAASEVGPLRRLRPMVPISRTQTLIVKSVMSAVLSFLSASLILLAATVVLGMDASHIPLLWIYSVCGICAVGLGTQAILAAFGSLGMIVCTFVYVALSLPSSGATVPLEAVPPFYRVLGIFEPMRQLTDGVRAILYFRAQEDAGLARGWVVIGAASAAALIFGFATTSYYDRKGLHRYIPRPT